MTATGGRKRRRLPRAYIHRDPINTFASSSPPVDPAPVIPFRAGSLSVTPKREGDALSHVTEAWQLPLPQARQRDNAAAAAADHPGEGKDSWDHLASGGGAGGAYVGLFRPPGGGGKVSEMGFHMCVAVVPLGEGEWSGAVAEEYSEQLSPSQGRRSEEARTQVRVVFTRV